MSFSLPLSSHKKISGHCAGGTTRTGVEACRAGIINKSKEQREFSGLKDVPWDDGAQTLTDVRQGGKMWAERSWGQCTCPNGLKNNINWIVSNRALAKKGVAGKEQAAWERDPSRATVMVWKEMETACTERKWERTKLRREGPWSGAQH